MLSRFLLVVFASALLASLFSPADAACNASNCKANRGLGCNAQGNCVCTKPLESQCGKSCVDTQTNSQHCGQCNSKCPFTTHCEGGDCVCPIDTLKCDTARGPRCVDSNSDPKH